MTLERIAESGIVGAGGAGFPTHAKLKTNAEIILINAAECEPLLHKDKELILEMPEQFVHGVREAMLLTKAVRGVIGIKKKYKHVINALKPKLGKNMEIAELDDVYPAGDEQILVYETLRRVVTPGGIPISVGVVVLNVETACNLAVAETTPVVDKYISVAGDVNRPCSFRVPIGTPLSLCIEAAGGASIPEPCFVIGGAMMGKLETDLSQPVTKTTGGIIVLQKESYIVQRKSWDWNRVRRVGIAACDQCTFCTEMCPRNLLGHPIEPHKAMRSLGFNASRQSDVLGTVFCCECNLCSYFACPEGLDPKNVCLENKQRLFAEKKRWENPPFRTDRPFTHFGNRKIPTASLIRRIGLAKYKNEAPMYEAKIEPSVVTIPLKQHIGAACQPIVSAGQNVKRGERIAVVPLNALGADIHASINGVVDSVGKDCIVILISPKPN